MASRPRIIIPEAHDPLDDAVQGDRLNVADQLAQVLEDLGSVDQGTIKGILYRIPVPNGKYEWIRDVYPPFDMSEVMRSLKEEIGGGDYALRLMAEGKVRKTLHFSIMRELTKPQDKKSGGDDMMMMFQIMMQTQAANQQAAQASADRQMQMMMAANQQSSQMMMGMMTAIVPALAGGREKTSDLMQAMAAMQPKSEGMKEALETLTLAKGLFKEEGGKESPGFDADDIVGSVARMAGPIAGAVGRAFQSRNGSGAEQVTAAQVEYPPHQTQLMLDANQPPYQPPLEQLPGADRQRHPVLALIRDDVMYTFTRNHDPERAADLVYDTIEAHGVTEEQINDLVGAFAISPDWLSELANEGIDLRSNPEWANAFLSALVSIHTDPNRERADFGGQGGGDPNAGLDGEARAPG